MKFKNILILGGAGGLSYLLSKLLLTEHKEIKICAVDTRKANLKIKDDRYKFKKIKYSKGNFENLFRDENFDAVIHLARMSHSREGYQEVFKRLELNIIGTNTILDLCEEYKIKKVIILSTFHVYGALADNPVFITEDSPLRASINYPELRDVVEMDQVATSWMWKHQQETETVVLRPCNIIGSLISNTMSRYLASSTTISPMDYKPMFQFIHEFDMANVLYQSLVKLPTGTYNVAPDDYIDLKKALNFLGSKPIPFPMFLAHLVNRGLSKIGLKVPEYFIEYLKYSCLISNKKLKSHLSDLELRFTTSQALELIKLS